eukprot:TRINITY_DN961_c0_g2_i1.p1 TRINITY_DN961_c0_g2~~TRINITY_DN961_c0_g2_i1.p1  ORF type:complete len:176 (-),score=18.08 TRINITY_DN961_c0_g2_i1:640-1167(-)
MESTLHVHMKERKREREEEEEGEKEELVNSRTATALLSRRAHLPGLIACQREAAFGPTLGANFENEQLARPFTLCRDQRSCARPIIFNAHHLNSICPRALGNHFCSADAINIIKNPVQSAILSISILLGRGLLNLMSQLRSTSESVDGTLSNRKLMQMRKSLTTERCFCCTELHD